MGASVVPESKLSLLNHLRTFSPETALRGGLLLITLPEMVIDRLLLEGRSGEYQVEVDLENNVVRTPDGKEQKFEYDPFRRHCLLEGAGRYRLHIVIQR